MGASRSWLNAHSTPTPTPSPSRRSLFGGAAAVLVGTGITAGAAASVADLVPANPDAELLDLGRRLVEGWRRVDNWCATSPDQSDEGLEAVMAPLGAVVDQIEHATAYTFEGVQVKALAVSWCNSGEEIDPDRFNPYEGAATDGRIAASIVRDLLRVQSRGAAGRA